jgi:hypothetical protein
MHAAENEKTVYIQELPEAVVRALTAQLQKTPEIRLVAAAGDAAPAPDLVICGGAASPPHAAVPVVRYARGARLGDLMAALRRALDEPFLAVTPFHVAGNLFVPATRTLKRADADDVLLTEREAALLLHLARHAPAAVPRDALLRAVWNYQSGIDTHTLETHIYRLRQKISGSDKGHVLMTLEEGYALRDVTPA